MSKGDAHRYSKMTWAEYIELVRERHGDEAADIAEKFGSAEAGDAAELQGRQRARERRTYVDKRGRRRWGR